MTESNQNPDCPKCGAPVSDEAPAGLCPKCVLGGAATLPDRGNPTIISDGGRIAPPTPEELTPHFPDLEIIELVGAGGMGAVYKARQPKLDRMVALKILTKDLAEDPAFVERFNREARVLAKLSHPNIVTVFDFGTAGPFCFLVMEFVDGVNLRQAMRDGGGFSSGDSLALVSDVCEALGFAHEEGVMHRDIKPENILIDSRGRVKIADFGIAKLVGDTASNDLTLTLQGSVMGSPQYMAPEQIETPGDVDQRADIYSLGVVFYELLTGELPLGRFALPSEKAPMDARIDEIVMRTLEKEREARFQSAGEVETQLEAISQGGTTAAPPTPAAGTASADDEPAKFALTSAILTSSALLMALLSVFVLPMLAWKGRNEVNPMGSMLAGYATFTLLVGIPAILGMVFGFRALGEIRRSGGRKPGLGSAMFGAMTTPSIAIVAAIGGLILLFLHATDTAIGSPYLIGLIVAIAGPLLVFGLIRRVARWARGEEPEEKASMPGWRVALNIVVALLVAAVVYGVFFATPAQSEREGIVLEKAQLSLPAPNPYREMWKGVWTDGAPDFIGKLSVPSGHIAQVQLIHIEGVGRETATELWVVEAPDDKPFNALIALGNPDGLQAKQEPGVAALKGTLWNQDSGEVQHYDKFFNGVLQLNIREALIELDGETPFEATLGGLLPAGGGSADQGASTLSLVITSEPRATNDNAGVAEALPAPKPIAEIEMAYTAPAGQISVFALQAPWDKKHESPDDWYIVAPDDADLNGRISFAMTDGGRSSHAVDATLLDGDGEILAKHRFFAPENHTMSLPSIYPTFEMDALPDGEITGPGEPPTSPESIDLNRPGLHMVVFGHEEGSEVVDSLRLLAWSMPKPDGADVEDWMRHQFKRLNEKKWKPQLEDEDMFRISQMEGDIRARSGFLFDTRERVLNPKKTGLPSVPSALNNGKNFVVDTLKRGESLILPKGSRAKLESSSGGEFQIGPQTGDALLVLDMDARWILPLPENALTLQVDKVPGGEFTIIIPSSMSSLTIREPAAFQLGSDGKLQVFEGEVVVVVGGSDERTLTSGQAFTFPKPPTAP